MSQVPTERGWRRVPSGPRPAIVRTRAQIFHFFINNAAGGSPYKQGCCWEGPPRLGKCGRIQSSTPRFHQGTVSPDRFLPHSAILDPLAPGKPRKDRGAVPVALLVSVARSVKRRHPTQPPDETSRAAGHSTGRARRTPTGRLRTGRYRTCPVGRHVRPSTHRRMVC
jgi:hypothetical protein